jgi:uncharacterized protein
VSQSPLWSSVTMFGAGALFSVGLVMSGMTLPTKVVAFLDITGEWDPSLAFVMGAAVFVHFVLNQLILRRPSPIFAGRFSIPTRTDIDGRLVGGAALFGMGWGLGGYCPGPVIASLSSLAVPVLVFFGSMVTGMVIFKMLNTRIATNPGQPVPAFDENADDG